MDRTLLFDADCGFCSRCAAWCDGRTRTVALRPLQSVDLEALGIDADRATREVPLLGADGTVEWGSAAIASCLADCSGPWRSVGRLLAGAPVQVVARPVYRLVARHRHRLPGGTAACRLSG